MKFIKSANLLLVIISFLFLMYSCKDKSATAAQADKQEKNNKELFYGKVVYTSKIEAPDSLLENTLSSLSPFAVEIYFAEKKFRLIEQGGLSNGNIIVYLDLMEAWQLDTIKKMAYLGEYSDLSNPSEELQDLLPDHFAPTVESTGIKEIIAGQECIKYKILRSGIIPAGDEAYIWVANNLQFPSSRFDIQTEINYTTVPAPLFIGYEGGAILRLYVKSKTYSRTIEVVELTKGPVDENIFLIPENYQKK